MTFVMFFTVLNSNKSGSLCDFFIKKFQKRWAQAGSLSWTSRSLLIVEVCCFDERLLIDDPDLASGQVNHFFFPEFG